MKTCDRCGATTKTWTMSMFNTQEICPVCKEQERKHPRYQEACGSRQRSHVATITLRASVGLPHTQVSKTNTDRLKIPMDKVIADYQRGMNATALVEKYGGSGRTIQRRLKRAGFGRLGRTQIKSHMQMTQSLLLWTTRRGVPSLKMLSINLYLK